MDIPFQMQKANFKWNGICSNKKWDINSIIWLVEFDKDCSTIVLSKLNSFAEYILTIQKTT